MSKDLTNYEFEGLVKHITDLYKTKEGLTDTYDTATGQLLIQLIADSVDNLHYKLERRSQENYSSTARLASSVRAAVSSVGYRPRRKVSSTGTVKLSLLDVNGVPTTSQGNITLNHGDAIYFDDIQFIVDGDYTIAVGESEIDINVKQGKYVTETFNFNEEPYLTNNYIEFANSVDKEEHSISISGNGDVFNDVLSSASGLRIRSISFADKDNPVYDIKNTKNGMRIEFGDGIFGKKPTGNVQVSWVESSGSSVNIIKTGLTFKLDSEILYDDVIVNPQNEYKYTITNTTAIRGGQDEETIEEMRTNVVSFIRTNDRAVSNFDYEFWVKRSGIGGISDVNVYGEHETNQLIFTMNNVYVAYATPDKVSLNSTQINQLRDYLSTIKENTAHLVFKKAEHVYLGLDIYLKRHPSLPVPDSQLYKILSDKVNEYFAIKSGSIGKEFQHSEFIEYLQNLKITFNNITYNATDFVRVDVVGMSPFEIPLDVYDGVIEISSSYAVVPNDVLTVLIDGVSYSIVATGSDTITTLTDKLHQKIFENTALMLARESYNKIRIKHPSDTGVYNISIGTGDLSAHTTFSQLIKIPKPNNSYNPNTDLILPGSVKIVDDAGNIILKDNGLGLLVDPDGVNPSSTIDYTTCTFSYPSIPEKLYYVQFQQDEYQNFKVTRDSIVDLMPIKDSAYTGNAHFFSKINILR